MKRYIFFTIISVVSSLTLLYGSETDFPGSYRYGDLSLQRRGVGVLMFKRIIPAYSGAFYLEGDISADSALMDVAKKLELHYYHNIKARDFAEATREMVRKNVTDDEYKRISTDLTTFVSLYRDVQKNDRYALVYIPHEGTYLKYNGKTLGRVGGKALSRALFSIWIGARPIDTDFRQTLLGLE